MVKATGGGGGIGLLACHDAAEVADAFARVQRLATPRNFAAAGVFLERLVRQARHVEVQVFGDGTGQVAVLGDRDCSLQRRNQKVIEEAPAPGLPPSLRRQLHEAARDLAASVAYRSAGTVEFVYDPARQEASFLEVNARLQVEHPVTEEVYRVDLVEQMLRLAGQGPEGVAEFMASRHVPRGHAVEARVYAEDPNHGGRPSPGLVTAVSWPPRPTGAGTAAGVRVDAWIEAGLEVSPSYDPMLAKVIAVAGDREQAMDGLGAALGGHPGRRRRHQPGAAARGARAPGLPVRRALDLDAGRAHRSRAADRGAGAGRADDRAGLAGAPRLLAGRRAAERPDGRGVAARGQPRRRQPRGRAGAGVHRHRPEPEVLPRHGRVPGRRGRRRVARQP